MLGVKCEWYRAVCACMGGHQGSSAAVQHQEQRRPQPGLQLSGSPLSSAFGAVRWGRRRAVEWGQAGVLFDTGSLRVTLKCPFMGSGATLRALSPP